MLDLEFKLQASKQYIVFISAVLITSMIIVMSLPLAWWLNLMGVVLTGIYGAYIFWQFGLLRSKHSIISMRRLANGGWMLFTNQSHYRAELCGDSTVTGVVSILRFRGAENLRKKSCVIFRDSLEAQRYRQLLAVLKMD